MHLGPYNPLLPFATKLRRLRFYRHLSVHKRGCVGVCLSACWDTTPPREQTPPKQTHPPPEKRGAVSPGSRPPYPGSRHPPQSRHTPRDTVTAAGSTHPTGMHSCLANSSRLINRKCEWTCRHVFNQSVCDITIVYESV